MSTYNILLDEIENRYINDELTLENVNDLCNLVYDKYFSEAEKNHYVHNLKKNQVARSLNKKPSELHNKKYDTPEKARRADLRYKFDDAVKDGKHSSYFTKMKEEEIPPEKRVPGGPDKIYKLRDATTYDLSEVPESDIKKLKYMKKHANPSNPKEIENYRRVFKMFCNKYGINENSTLYVELEPDVEWGGQLTEWHARKPLKSLDNKDKTKKEINDDKEVPIKVPDGYSLIHKCRTDGLTVIKPKLYSNKYIGQSQGNPVNGQYNMSGRVYFLLIKDTDISIDNEKIKKVGGSGGKSADHIYKLTTTPKNLYLDSESFRSHGNNNNPTLNNLLAQHGSCAVYVKTSTPLPVKQLI